MYFNVLGPFMEQMEARYIAAWLSHDYELLIQDIKSSHSLVSLVHQVLQPFIFVSTFTKPTLYVLYFSPRKPLDSKASLQIVKLDINSMSSFIHYNYSFAKNMHQGTSSWIDLVSSSITSAKRYGKVDIEVETLFFNIVCKK